MRVLNFLKLWWDERLRAAVVSLAAVCILCAIIALFFTILNVITYAVVSLGFVKFAATFKTASDLFNFCSAITLLIVLGSGLLAAILFWLNGIVSDIVRLWNKSRSMR